MLPDRLAPGYWLLRDTARQLRATGLVWALGVLCLLAVVLCASAEITPNALDARSEEVEEFLPRGDRDVALAGKERIPVISGELTLGFGALRVPLGRDRHDAVHFLELVLAAVVADTLGLLLALIWTAGLLPGFLDPRHLAVLLSKPAARWRLLVGKYLSVVLLVGVYATVFVSSTWLALGWRTGVWTADYWWCVPLSVMHFAVFFAFSTAVAVLLRSTAASILATLGFWLVCWGTNFGRHAMLASAYEAAGGQVDARWNGLIELSYWVLPKPADLGWLLQRQLSAESVFAPLAEFTSVSGHGDLSLGLSVASSLAFLVIALAAAAHSFTQVDY